MLQHLIIIYFSLHLTSGRLQEVEKKGKFQTFSFKKWSWLLTRVGHLQEALNVVN